jgi:hypothetical protein
MKDSVKIDSELTEMNLPYTILVLQYSIYLAQTLPLESLFLLYSHMRSSGVTMDYGHPFKILFCRGIRRSTDTKIAS